jgi:hypothetical protein
MNEGTSRVTYIKKFLDHSFGILKLISFVIPIEIAIFLLLE